MLRSTWTSMHIIHTCLWASHTEVDVRRTSNEDSWREPEHPSCVALHLQQVPS